MIDPMKLKEAALICGSTTSTAAERDALRARIVGANEMSAEDQRALSSEMIKRSYRIKDEYQERRVLVIATDIAEMGALPIGDAANSSSVTVDDATGNPSMPIDEDGGDGEIAQ